MNFANKNILVTGATGLVGSHLVEKLLELGPDQIVCLTRSKNPRSYFFSNGFDEKVICADGDLKNKERVFDIVAKYEINHIFHVAAQPIVPVAFVNPHETLLTNIIGTINILEAVRCLPNILSVVVASSDKAYGKNSIEATENFSMIGDHPYDVSKSCADLIARAYAKTYDLPITVSRFANIYGPGDLNFNRIIPGILKAAIKGETLEIRSDGTFVRDYLYVKDVVDGYVQLAENIDKTKGEAFNFSAGFNFSVLELIEKISLVLGKEIKYKILNNQKNEIPKQSLNVEKVFKVLGWKANYDFAESIKATYEWYKKFFAI